MRRYRKRDEEFLETLKMIAPGTELYMGMESVLRAKTGALIVIGYNELVNRLISGGFFINADFTPSSLYELAKMDGAVILSNDGKKILYANVELSPDPSLQTHETGIRHRSAERTAQQTELAVVSISQRRDIITLFKGSNKYVFQDENKLLAKANQALQTLEKYRVSLDEGLSALNILEVEDKVTLGDVCIVLKFMEMVYRVAEEVEVYLVQLGTEGRLISMQLEEQMASLDKEYRNIVYDYENMEEGFSLKTFTERMSLLSDEEVLDLGCIAQVLEYENDEDVLDAIIVTRGYRQMAHIPKLPHSIIAKVIHYYKDFQKVLDAKSHELEEVEGIGEVRAKVIFEGLRRKRETAKMYRDINL